MSLLQTARFDLPLLAVSQAQKEVTHNEALVKIDALLHSVAEARLSSPPVLADEHIGQCWLIGDAATGDWIGKSDQLAIWIGNDWRFISPAEGMNLRLKAPNSDAVFTRGNWIFAPTIVDPAGGAVIDVEARRAIISLLDHLRTIGYVTR
ncbi:DUF2793 domain-containing protein [Sphingorhabdus sp. IMCC26285]|uniref:DUF2793 domain-containing protein n=1 Tax=Sphingorhabdus profundilacus TaxID=2509718 RepID=A0A6I4M6L7_9SPHN|nr:DUF2793 domain-containing protein [Sphingorhabdus profundilacus]MVZ97775.1 DUF2793 domain-containing protein [Sphingorhabdus profundilacus]